MISTPILDYARRYAQGRPVRLHMPGHKGRGPLGCEALDITEIDGADNLFAPEGIIAESEANAGRLFGARTFYVTEGSSLGIRAMLALATLGLGRRARVLAARNVHKVFLSAAALLDFELDWLSPAPGDTYHSCAVDPGALDRALAEQPADAVYLTSPDYLGHVADIAAVARVCHRRGALLLVDNAHGAYLRFLTPDRHPISLGADLCCDSAHKTLPVLTGGGYLHLRADSPLADRARDALALFASTSPSYLIMQSLDACNRWLAEEPGRCDAFAGRMADMKRRLTDAGWTLTDREPLKLTLDARAAGTTGDALAAALTSRGCVPEFHDPDFLTLMFTPMNTDDELRRFEDALLGLPVGAPLPREAPPLTLPRRAMSPREACFAPGETLPVTQCLGRVLAAPAVSCPPAVPIVMCGEVIDEAAVARFRYYGIQTCRVVIA